MATPKLISEVQKRSQQPEDEKIKSEVRKLQVYIAEHVREYYDCDKDVDPGDIFGFKPLQGPSVGVAIRRYIAGQALGISKHHESRSATQLNTDEKVQQIHHALTNYRRSEKKDECKAHLRVVLELAGGLEKQLRLPNSEWGFGPLGAKKQKSIDVISFPSFLKGGNPILPGAYETVCVHSKNEWGRKNFIARAKATRNKFARKRSSSRTSSGDPASPGLFNGHHPTSAPDPDAARRATTSDPVSPLDQEDIPWSQPRDPRHAVPLLLLDLVIYLLCLIRQILEGSDNQLSVPGPSSISVPSIRPRLPPHFESLGLTDHILQLMAGPTPNNTNSTDGEGKERTQLETLPGAGESAKGGESAGLEDLSEEDGRDPGLGNEAGDQKKERDSKESGSGQKYGGLDLGDLDQQGTNESSTAPEPRGDRAESGGDRAGRAA